MHEGTGNLRFAVILSLFLRSPGGEPQGSAACHANGKAELQRGAGDFLSLWRLWSVDHFRWCTCLTVFRARDFVRKEEFTFELIIFCFPVFSSCFIIWGFGVFYGVSVYIIWLLKKFLKLFPLFQSLVVSGNATVPVVWRNLMHWYKEIIII